MKELVKYIEQIMRYAVREDSSTSDVKRFMDNAFGAAEMFSILHPELSQLVAGNWNDEWRPMFEKLLRQKYL